MKKKYEPPKLTMISFEEIIPYMGCQAGSSPPDAESVFDFLQDAPQLFSQLMYEKKYPEESHDKNTNDRLDSDTNDTLPLL